MDRIEFLAEIVRATTMKDGTVRVVFDLPESELAEAVRIVALIVKKPLVRVSVVPQ